MKPVQPWQRWRKTRRCPVCHGAQEDPSGRGVRCFGFLSDDGEYLHCSREEYAHGIHEHVESLTFPHRRFGRCDCGEYHDYAGNNITEEPEPKKEAQGKPKPKNLWYKMVDEYTYRDVDGAILAYKQRLEAHDKNGNRLGKMFSWFDANHDPGTKGIHIPPYRIERVVQSHESEPVYFVEGERCVRLLEMNGKIAICSPWASSQRWDIDPLYFSRRKIYLFPDNDNRGKKHMNYVAEKLAPYASEIKLVVLPLEEPGADVVDWFTANRTMSEIEDLIQKTEPWKSPFLSAQQSITSAIRRYRETKS